MEIIWENEPFFSGTYGQIGEILHRQLWQDWRVAFIGIGVQ